MNSGDGLACFIMSAVPIAAICWICLQWKQQKTRVHLRFNFLFLIYYRVSSRYDSHIFFFFALPFMNYITSWFSWFQRVVEMSVVTAQAMWIILRSKVLWQRVSNYVMMNETIGWPNTLNYDTTNSLNARDKHNAISPNWTVEMNTTTEQWKWTRHSTMTY